MCSGSTIGVKEGIHRRIEERNLAKMHYYLFFLSKHSNTVKLNVYSSRDNHDIKYKNQGTPVSSCTFTCM